MIFASTGVPSLKTASDLRKNEALIINMSGRGDKDIFTIANAYGDPSWKEFIIERAEQYKK